MPADHQIDTAALQREVALHSHQFPDWEKPTDHERALSGAEIVALLVVLGKALADIDKSLGATEAILGRLGRLYRWVRAGPAKAHENDAALGERERILVLLFDAYVTQRRPMSVERLAALSGVRDPECKKHLAFLEAKDLVVSTPGGDWLYRRA